MDNLERPREIAATIVESIVSGNSAPDINYPKELHELVGCHVKNSMDILDFHAKRILSQPDKYSRRRVFNLLPKKLQPSVEKYCQTIWKKAKP